MLNNIRATQTLLISLSVKGGGSAPKDLQAKPPTTGIGSLLTIVRSGQCGIAAHPGFLEPSPTSTKAIFKL